MADSTADASQIQQDLDETRSRMDERLSAIQQRLSPGQILDNLMGYFKNSEGADFARDLMSSVRGNPLPAALTGIGLTWLMASGNRTPAAPSPSKPREPLKWPTPEAFDDHFRSIDAGMERQEGDSDLDRQGRVYQARAEELGLSRGRDEDHESFGARITSAMTAAKDEVVKAAQSLAGQAGDAAGAVGDAAQAASERVAQAAQAGPQMAGDLYASIVRNPVMLGAIGFSVGALLGAAMPQSETEEKALHDVADKARAGASALAQTVVDKGAGMADAAMQTAKDTADSQGLTSDTSLGGVLKDIQSGAIVDKVKKVATDVLASANDKQS